MLPIFKGLDKVGLQGVFQKRGHRAGRLELAAGHELVVVGVADHDTAQALVNVGAQIAAMTPGELASWLAENLQS